MQLSPEHEALRDTVKRFADEYVNPFIDQWEEAQILDRKSVV